MTAYKKHFAILFLVLTFFGVTVFFQNCGVPLKSMADEPGQETVIIVPVNKMTGQPSLVKIQCAPKVIVGLPASCRAETTTDIVSIYWMIDDAEQADSNKELYAWDSTPDVESFKVQAFGFNKDGQLVASQRLVVKTARE